MVVHFASSKKNEPSILVLLNASHVVVPAKIPYRDTHKWKPLLSTVAAKATTDSNEDSIQLEPRSVYIYQGDLISQ
jgi:hypothetical protein